MACTALWTTIRRWIGWWIRRYLLAELVGTTLAVLAVLAAGDSPHLGALWGSIAETVGFYAVMLARDTAGQRRSGVPGSRALLLTLRGMAVEFGPAELVDTLLARPALLFLCIALTASMVAGTISGKLAGDVIFDSIVVLCFQLRMRLFPPARRPAIATVPYDGTADGPA